MSASEIPLGGNLSNSDMDGETLPMSITRDSVTCPSDIGPGYVYAFQTNSRGSGHPPGFLPRWVFYFVRPAGRTHLEVEVLYGP